MNSGGRQYLALNNSLAMSLLLTNRIRPPHRDCGTGYAGPQKEIPLQTPQTRKPAVHFGNRTRLRKRRCGKGNAVRSPAHEFGARMIPPPGTTGTRLEN